jgi:hypothetical protein
MLWATVPSPSGPPCSTSLPNRIGWLSGTKTRRSRLRGRLDVKGWGPWSVKEGVIYARAPASALEQVLAIRVHLDDSTAENGPLKVLPVTHKLGVLSDDAIHELAERTSPVECHVGSGGLVLMKPLLVHASSKSKNDAPRRVLHIEWAAEKCFPGGLELSI